ncbi:MAG: ribosomal protein S18-alanine N-acetyltransferase [Promethearchaeota archaeon]
MNTSHVIRYFKREDIETVMGLNKTCLPENYPESFFVGLFQHAPSAFLVAELNGHVIGYIMCRIERGISSYRTALPVKKGHIVSVAVARKHRRGGIGTELIVSAMKGMAEYGAKEFFLEVRKSNEAAIKAYENLGFDVRRVLKGYYRDGEDAYLMVKEHNPDGGDEPVDE